MMTPMDDQEVESLGHSDETRSFVSIELMNYTYTR